ncbi:type I secretion system permease/ATPase [Rhizobium sp. 0TCS1.26]|uniref:type I secretion system permease/ATPase n=1 Tax=Rhizobium sp. 0TCS1.26 TaxID=3142623 RepID=UPI003D2C8A4E
MDQTMPADVNGKTAASIPADAWVEVLGCLAQRLGIPHSKFAASYFAIAEEDVPPIQRIERLARRFGIDIRAVEPSAANISSRRLPMLVQLSDGAVALIVSADEDHVRLIFGGDNGQWTRVARSDLRDRIVYLMVARDAREGSDGRLDPALAVEKDGWFRQLVLRDLRPYGYVLVATLVANLLSLAGVIFSMQVYDRAVPAQSVTTLTVLFSGVMLAVVFDFFMRRVRTAIIDVVGKRADIKVSDRVFGHALRVKNQHRPKATGTFISQLRDLEQVRDLLTSTTVSAVADLPFFLIFLVLFWYIGGILVIIPAVALVLLVAPGLLAQRKLKRIAGLAMKESALRNAMLVESVQGFEDIKALQAEPVFQQRWNHFNAASADANMKLRTLTNSLSSWSHSVQTSVFAVIVFCGAPMVMAGDLTTGALVACSILGSRMIAPMAQMAQILSRYQHAKLGLKSLDSIMKLPTDHPDAERRISVSGLSGHYQFRATAFHHGEATGRPALVLNSFTVEPGQKIALLGKNGAGKSTLLMALSGMIEPASGEALVDHLSIAHIDPEDLRRDIGIVMQQSRLFYGTIRENVLLGAQDAPQSALLEALSITGADEFIRQLPNGLDHMIEEGGRGLSGGQQQALLLSRLIIRDPNIVLLDEPTASMDEATERLFISRFAAWSKGKTVIVATHRMRMLDLVERVVALDAGRIILDAPKAEALAKLRGTSATEAAKEVLAASKTSAANTDTIKPAKVRKPAASRNKATAS